MAIQIQLRRGSATEHNSFTGVIGEATINTTNNSLHIHDGLTVGGFELARKDLSNIGSGSIANVKLANSTISGVALGSNLPSLTIGTGLNGSSYNGTSAVTISLANTAVTAGSYGSQTQIPVLTIDAQGRVTAASTATVSSTLPIAGDTGTDNVSLLTDTLTFTGGVGITSTVTNNAVTFDIDSTVATLTGTQTLTNKALTAFDQKTGTTSIANNAVVQSTIASTTQTAIDTFAATTYRSAKYVVQITQGSNYQVSELLVIHNGATATITEYGVIATNGSLGTLSADISGGNFRLLLTMAAATSATINITRSTIVV